MHTAEAGLKETDVSNGVANQRTPSHLGFRRLCTSPVSQDDRSPQPLGPAAGVVLPCPFPRGSFCHVSCTCEDRCPCPRVFTHVTAYVGFQIRSLESRPSNNSNTNANNNNNNSKHVFWNRLVNPKRSSDLVTLTARQIHSRVPPGSWGHIFLDPVTVGCPELGSLRRGCRSRQSGHGSEDTCPGLSQRGSWLPWHAPGCTMSPAAGTPSLFQPACK